MEEKDITDLTFWQWMFSPKQKRMTIVAIFTVHISCFIPILPFVVIHWIATVLLLCFVGLYFSIRHIQYMTRVDRAMRDQRAKMRQDGERKKRIKMYSKERNLK